MKELNMVHFKVTMDVDVQYLVKNIAHVMKSIFNLMS